MDRLRYIVPATLIAANLTAASTGRLEALIVPVISGIYAIARLGYLRMSQSPPVQRRNEAREWLMRRFTQVN